LKTLVICRGSVKEGLGHLFRSRTFANTVAEKGKDIKVIAIIPEEMESLFQNVKFPSSFVRHDKDVIPLINAEAPQVVVFDLIAIDREVFEHVKKKQVRTISISPIFEWMEEIDLLFTRTDQSPNYKNVKVYSGLEYAIFNQEIERIPDEVYQRNLNSQKMSVAISMGGGDAVNNTLQVLRSVIHLSEPTVFWVLLGMGFNHCYNELVQTTVKTPHHEIILAKTNQNMWHILSNCVIGIFTGGLTTIESVYAGLPSINIFQSRRYRDVINPELFEKGICLDGGEFSDHSLKKTTEILNDINKNRNKLWELHKASQNLIEKEGSCRIFRIIEQTYNAN
jgi:spore coat polysaccharide biosynthesis predicted glycosyltransferase SpsG